MLWLCSPSAFCCFIKLFSIEHVEIDMKHTTLVILIISNPTKEMHRIQILKYICVFISYCIKFYFMIHVHRLWLHNLAVFWSVILNFISTMPVYITIDRIGWSVASSIIPANSQVLGQPVLFQDEQWSGKEVVL
jgi:hypothetical protein